jgi:hypothetical protein
MQPHPDTFKPKAHKILAFLLGVIALVLTLYSTDVYLKSNFSYNGEAYFKGVGHLIRENFWKAIVFLGSRHLLVSTIVSFMLFSLMSKEGRQQLFRMLSYVALAIIVLVLVYTAYQVYNIINEGYDREDRIIEIALTWLLRVLGFYAGYWLANTIFSKQNLKHVS